MVRVTDFGRPKRTYDKDDSVRRPLPPQDSAYQSQRVSQNPRSEARRLKRKAIRESDKECFFCRETGHLSQDCPQNTESAESPNTPKICYRCGRVGHSLKDCKKAPQKPQNRKRKRTNDESSDDSEIDIPEQEVLPYAKCYVCQQNGHLAGFCPQNERGIYPNGGACKLCGMPPQPKLTYDITKLTGATDHLRRKCPQKEAIERGAVAARNPDATTGADEDIYHEKLRAELLQSKNVARPTVQGKRKPKVVSF